MYHSWSLSLCFCGMLFFCYLACMNVWFVLQTGAATVENTRKLMALSGKVKPHDSKTPLPALTSPNLSGGRRQPISPRHSRQPVHLTAESSSVVSLSNIANRKPSRTGKPAGTWVMITTAGGLVPWGNCGSLSHKPIMYCYFVVVCFWYFVFHTYTFLLYGKKYIY